jgi:hypothetical protein
MKKLTFLLLAACGGFPVAQPAKLPLKLNASALVAFQGDVFLISDTVDRLDGSTWTAEIGQSATVFTDGDELWARTGDGVLRRTGPGSWDDVAIPINTAGSDQFESIASVEDIIAVLPGSDAWVASYSEIYHRVGGQWQSVPVTVPDGVIYDLTRAGGDVWASTGDGFDDDVIIRLSDGAQFTVTNMNAHFPCDGTMCWDDASQVAHVDGSRSVQAPAQPTSYGTAPIPVSARGASDSVLWLNQWQDGGGSSLGGASFDVTSQVSRLEGSGWTPVVELSTGGIEHLVEPSRGLLFYIDGIDVFRVDMR